MSLSGNLKPLQSEIFFFTLDRGRIDFTMLLKSKKERQKNKECVLEHCEKSDSQLP